MKKNFVSFFVWSPLRGGINLTSTAWLWSSLPILLAFFQEKNFKRTSDGIDYTIDCIIDHDVDHMINRCRCSAGEWSSLKKSFSTRHEPRTSFWEFLNSPYQHPSPISEALSLEKHNHNSIHKFVWFFGTVGSISIAWSSFASSRRFFFLLFSFFFSSKKGQLSIKKIIK